MKALTIDDLAYRHEIRAEILRALSQLSPHEARELLVELAVSIQRSSQPDVELPSRPSSPKPIIWTPKPGPATEKVGSAELNLSESAPQAPAATSPRSPAENQDAPFAETPSERGSNQAPQLHKPRRVDVIKAVVRSEPGITVAEMLIKVAEELGDLSSQDKNRTRSALWQLENQSKVIRRNEDDQLFTVSLPDTSPPRASTESTGQSEAPSTEVPTALTQ